MNYVGAIIRKHGGVEQQRALYLSDFHEKQALKAYHYREYILGRYLHRKQRAKLTSSTDTYRTGKQ